MKSILLKTLAATSLVATAPAEVYVLSAVWRERGLSAPEGVIVPMPGTVAVIRAFMIFDESITTATPGPGTLIQYRDARSGGVISRTYTIQSDFRAFNGDLISGFSGGRRIYGSIHAPMTINNLPGATMPYSGTTFSNGIPRRLGFDNTVFQTVTSTGLTGPQVVDVGATLARSALSGSATSISVEAATIPGATAELEARLIRSGYSRAATAPVITTDLPATLAVQDGGVQLLSVVVGNAFPAPTYQWFRNDTAIGAAQGGTSPTLIVTGADPATGAGTYRVEVSTSAGTAVSATTTVTPLEYTFATNGNLPATVPLQGANLANLSVTLDPAPIVPPTYQWFKGAVQVAEAVGGKSPVLTVIGGEAATGAGLYRVEITSSAGTLVSGNANVTVAAAGSSFAFTVNTPRTFAAPFATPTNIPGGTVNPTFPAANVTRQWFKAPTNDPTNFEAIPAGNGGISATFQVVGNVDAPNGPGVYRLVATSNTGAVITSFDTVVGTAP
jgi:hypothetical protein